MIELIKNFVFFSAGVWVAAKFIPGVRVKKNTTVFIVALVYGVIYFLLYKILMILSLPLQIVTLGLFTIVINAFLLWLTDKMLDDFEIDSFGWTFVASIVISVVTLILKFLFAWL